MAAIGRQIDLSVAIRSAALVLAFALAQSPVHAVGGHHTVDDAAMIEPGVCEFEAWGERERGAARTLAHSGLGCRAGPVELAIGADRTRVAGGPATTSLIPQLKWATAFAPRWSAGVIVWGTWQTGGDGGYRGSTLMLPVTWQAVDSVAVHLNAGRDFRRGEPHSSRSGVAVEWMPAAAWSAVAERYRESGANFWRAGGRWSPTPELSVDISRAAGMSGGPAPWWTLGMKLAFGQ